MEAVVKAIEVTLTVEVHNSRLIELPRLRLVDDDVFNWHDFFKKLLEIFTGDL